jgi:hypothetical protein
MSLVEFNLIKAQWQRGYGAFSVSQSMVSTVRQYTANQREHHRTQDFKQECLQLLSHVC